MQDIIVKWCSEHIPLITMFIATIVCVILGTLRVAKWYYSLEKQVKSFEKHGEKVEQEIIPALNDIKKSISNLLIYLKSKDKSFDSNLFMSKSPIRLTPLGFEILNKIGGDKFVDDNKLILIERMNLRGINTALDSQIQAPAIIYEFHDDPSFKKIKDYIFNNPYYKGKNADGEDVEVALNLDSISNIIGIYLRDVYLDTRDDLNVEDI